MISLNLNPAETVQQHQFISFVEGSSSEAPEQSAFPLQVLGSDHNLNSIDGGDPTDGFSPWVTDILVYPSSEYWETLLDQDRVRPYIDLSISEYNTLRLPSAVHNYDLYVDQGKFYEDVVIDGGLTVGNISLGGSNLSIPGDINVGNDLTAVGNIRAETLIGASNTTAPILDVTGDVVFNNDHSGYLYHCEPAGSNLNITLPQTSSKGVMFTVNNTLAGKTVTFPNLINARGTVLGEQFSSATIYYDGSEWYGIGDLV